MARQPTIDAGIKETIGPRLLPLQIEVPPQEGLYGNAPTNLTLQSGLTVFVGPNGSGKTRTMQRLPDLLQQRFGIMQPRFLLAGRIAPLEQFRSDYLGEGMSPLDAFVGRTDLLPRRWRAQSIAGNFMALMARPDLMIKVEARLQALFGRRLSLRWSQYGIVAAFGTIDQQLETYGLGAEASGLLHLIGLLAAAYDDDVGALLIDEPEVSLHPQLQAFVLDELRAVSGDPYTDARKKLVVLATHSTNILRLRQLEDATELVFFRDHRSPPQQVARNAPELNNRRLQALVARMAETHKLAFFAKSVLLVEGPSDEIIASALASKLRIRLAAGGAQLVPVIGKGEIPQAARLFGMIGKSVVVLADLDAIADGPELVGHFNGTQQGQKAAEQLGAGSLSQLFAAMRTDSQRKLVADGNELQALSEAHSYWLYRGDTSDDVARRRATLAVLLTAPLAEIANLPHGLEWKGLRQRFIALLGALASCGCFVLRRGTIEDYFFQETPNRERKPAAAAEEAGDFLRG